MAFRYVLTVAVVGALVACWAPCGQTASTLSKIPGGQTAAAMLASSADGMSRYLAPNGPIQPGVSAVAGLPMRAGEMVNNGITRISSGFNNGAQRLSYAGGQNGRIEMPGMQALGSSMPSSLASMGESMQNMIRGKNNFIRGQAEAGIQAGNRLGDMMRQGLSVRSSGPMDMMSSAQDFMAKSGSTVQNQLKQHLEGTMSRLSGVRGIGAGMRDQAQGISRTLSNGVQGAAGQLQQTGEQVISQLQGNHQKNTQAMSGILGSLQNSMGSMSGNMQKNLDGLVRHAQSTGQQLTSSLQQAAQAPIRMLSNLGSGISNGLGNMMKGAGSSLPMGGRY